MYKPIKWQRMNVIRIVLIKVSGHLKQWTNQREKKTAIRHPRQIALAFSIVYRVLTRNGFYGAVMVNDSFGTRKIFDVTVYRWLNGSPKWFRENARWLQASLLIAPHIRTRQTHPTHQCCCVPSVSSNGRITVIAFYRFHMFDCCANSAKTKRHKNRKIEEDVTLAMSVFRKSFVDGRRR